jgi:steroid delta-isomerase-like uncharacterized protein
MSVEANKALVRRFIEQALAGGDFAALAELMAPDGVEHTAPLGQPPAEGTAARYLVLWRAAFPDLAITVEDLLAEGERVAVRQTVRGTHRGAFLGVPPTGRQIAVTGMAFYRLAGGRIVERWATVDTHEVLRQLGAPA